MTYNALGQSALDYEPCRYGKSKLLFRGPKRPMTAPYVSFFGGSEIYGKFVKKPTPALVETAIGVNCINFGIVNGGVDVVLNDMVLMHAASEASVAVVQIVGAQNLSNRFYSVHPRRNDRFVRASALLQAVYPEVDFAEFNFTRHMLSHLFFVSPQRFGAVLTELQTSWVARMKLMLSRIEAPVVLLWVSDHAPWETQCLGVDPALARSPLFVTREMIDQIAPLAAHFVEVLMTPAMLAPGTEEMVFSELEHDVAAQFPGPLVHREIARALAPILTSVMEEKNT